MKITKNTRLPATLVLGGNGKTGRKVAEALPDAASQGFVDLLDIVYVSGQSYVATATPFAMQPAPGAPISQRYLDFVYQPIRDDAGRVTGIFVEGQDVTEAFQAQAKQQLLLDELNHRVKNTLATVQAVVGQTLRADRQPEDFAAHLQARLKQGREAEVDTFLRAWVAAELAREAR